MIEYLPPKYVARWFYAESPVRPPGYYFYDETGAECCGPYETKEKCQAGLNNYFGSLEPRVV